jgi:hypothetical protein
MTGQMCWLPGFGKDGNLLLHLREHSQGSWRPYTFYSQYTVPDYQIPGGSKGWATAQKLMRSGWNLIPTEPEKNKFSSDLAVAAAAKQ